MLLNTKSESKPYPTIKIKNSGSGTYFEQKLKNRHQIKMRDGIFNLKFNSLILI